MQQRERWRTAVARAGGVVAARDAAGFFGALLAVATSLAIGADPQAVFAGLYAFSAVLTAVALGSVFNPPGRRVLIYTLLGVIFTVLVQGAFNTLLAPLVCRR